LARNILWSYTKSWKLCKTRMVKIKNCTNHACRRGREFSRGMQIIKSAVVIENRFVWLFAWCENKPVQKVPFRKSLTSRFTIHFCAHVLFCKCTRRSLNVQPTYAENVYCEFSVHREVVGQPFCFCQLRAHVVYN